MTVAQLIEKLQGFPQDMPVYLEDWNEQYAPDTPLTHMEIAEAVEAGRTSLPKRVLLS